jgi:hypothetical protein
MCWKFGLQCGGVEVVGPLRGGAEPKVKLMGPANLGLLLIKLFTKHPASPILLQQLKIHMQFFIAYEIQFSTRIGLASPVHQALEHHSEGAVPFSSGLSPPVPRRRQTSTRLEN